MQHPGSIPPPAATPPRAAETPWAWGVLVTLGLALALWRLDCVLAGPDADSDAYGHHMIARQILATPRDLTVHWVWLPLFHYLQAGLVALGATMQTIRYGNVLLTFATPLVLFAFLLRDRQGAARPPFLPFVAAALCALSPIGMQMGTTAQPEPLFALLVLATFYAWDRGRPTLAAVFLTSAALLRYEAWAIVPAFALVQGVDAARGKGRAWGRWWPIALPVVAILGWAALRRPADGGWFLFLRQTREFANDALHARSSFEGGAAQVARDLTYYAVTVPWRVMGGALLLVPFGVVRALRTRGPAFVLGYGACLAFLTLTWMMRSSLGLDRHFVVLVPFYATLAAEGLGQLANGIEAVSRRGGAAFARALGTVATVAGGAGASLAVVFILVTWMTFWRASLQRGWPDRVAVGAYLRSLPTNTVVFCDEATVEILSGLDRRRFDRRWIDAPDTIHDVESAAARDGVAFVATWERKLGPLLGIGEIVYRPPASTTPSVGEGAGLAVLRVLGPTQGAER